MKSIARTTIRIEQHPTNALQGKLRSEFLKLLSIPFAARSRRSKALAPCLNKVANNKINAKMLARCSTPGSYLDILAAKQAVSLEACSSQIWRRRKWN